MTSSRPASAEIDRDRLYAEYVASTDAEFDLLAEIRQSAGVTGRQARNLTAKLQRRLDAQAEESLRLWALYRTSEPTD